MIGCLKKWVWIGGMCFEERLSVGGCRCLWDDMDWEGVCFEERLSVWKDVDLHRCLEGDLSKAGFKMHEL
jgi:hypothetical protein